MNTAWLSDDLLLRAYRAYRDAWHDSPVAKGADGVDEAGREAMRKVLVAAMPAADAATDTLMLDELRDIRKLLEAKLSPPVKADPDFRHVGKIELGMVFLSARSYRRVRVTSIVSSPDNGVTLLDLHRHAELTYPEAEFRREFFHAVADRDPDLRS